MTPNPRKQRAASLINCVLALSSLIVCAAVVRAADTCSPPGFNVAPTVRAGAAPTSIVVADFNRDGLSDLAVANAGGSVSILLGSGAGTFAGPVNFATGGSSESVVAADFNGDGNVDLAVSLNSDRITVLLGDGQGAFGNPRTLVGGAIGPTSLTAGDFNGDGKSDLALTNANSNSVSVFLGSGSATFNGPTAFAAGFQPDSSAAADFNGDGKLDLVIVGGAGATILLGNGAGSFGAPASFSTAGTGFSVAVADLNGDGKLDLAVGHVFNNKVSVLFGTGTGSFTGTKTFVAGNDARFVMALDIDGDGKTDLLTANREADSLSVLLGDGAGNFVRVGDYATGAGPVHVAAADFNGDGRADLATTNVFSNDVSILMNAGGASLAAPTSLSFLNPSNTQENRSGPGAIVSGDLNGDGKLDVAIANFFSQDISVLLGTGAGTFGPRTNYPAGTRLQDLALGDFNADGKADLAVLTNDPDGVSVLLGNGAGGFGAPATFAAGSDPNGVTTGDFNNDGKTDLAVSNINSANVSILLGTGTGSFSGPTNFSAGPGPGDIVAADFNNDGKGDLAVANSFGGSTTIAILLGDGAGRFGAPASVTVGETPGSLAVGDFNADGRNDLAVATSFEVAVLLGTGTGEFSQYVRISAGFITGSIIAGDFDRNGTSDLAVALHRENRVSVLLNDGTGVFSGPFSFYAGAFPTGLVVRDFNADGRDDMVVTNLESDTVTILLGTQGQASPGTRICAASYNANESSRRVEVSVRRGGDLTGTALVRYETSNGTATDRSDYTTATGTLLFNPGEAVKRINILITDDALAENTEALTVRLFSPSGTTLGTPSTATVLINDNDKVTGLSPVSPEAFNVSFFVRQHYLDFLGREPDASGFNFWQNEITSCGADAQCAEVKRINVSAAFFLSIEFQETGYLVYRAYKAAYGDVTAPNVEGTVPVLRLREFLADTQQIGQGVQVNVGDWQQQLEANKNAYALDFVARQRFKTAFPDTMTADEFVSRLDQNAGGVLSPSEKSQLVQELGATPADAAKRAAVFRKVAEDSDLRQREFNRAFVLMQYFGYLRRNPDDAPDADFRGWKFWLDKLNQFGGNFVAAEMVKAFITSDEYRKRFGQ